MRIFLAGASGVIGRRLMPLLIDGGHEVAGTTRSAEKAELVRELSAEPVVIDVYEADALRDVVVDFAAAACQTAQLLDAATGTVEIVE